MTVGGPMQSMGAREARENLRVLSEQVAAGDGPVMILRDSRPAAVMISHKEAGRWERIQTAVYQLGGVGVFPELARSALDLDPLIRGDRIPTDRELKALASLRRDIFLAAKIQGIAEVRLKFAEMLDDLGRTGRPYTLVTYSRLQSTLIRPTEYDRLMSLSRIVAWFRASGLDLADTTPEASAQWVEDYRTRRSAAADADEGSAIA